MREEYGQHYETLYKNHWWWRSRELAVLSEIQKLDLKDSPEILDFGCGNALFLPSLARIGNVTGIETDKNLLKDGPFRDRVYHEPLGSKKYDGLKFDLITALDVLEHIEDDRGALEQLRKMLKPNGKIVLTVPASMKLWDEHDENNLHFRRYSRKTLLDAVPSSYHVRKIRYFNHGIYLPKRLIARINRSKKKKISQTNIPAQPINSVLTALSRVDFSLGKLIPVPFGSSLLMVLEAK